MPGGVGGIVGRRDAEVDLIGMFVEERAKISKVRRVGPVVHSRTRATRLSPPRARERREPLAHIERADATTTTV